MILVISVGYRKGMMYGEDDIRCFRCRCVGVSLYPRSQAEDVIGNCMQPVTELYFCLCLSNSSWLRTLCGDIWSRYLADCRAHHFVAEKPRICLWLRVGQAVLDCLASLTWKNVFSCLWGHFIACSQGRLGGLLLADLLYFQEGVRQLSAVTTASSASKQSSALIVVVVFPGPNPDGF